MTIDSTPSGSEPAARRWLPQLRSPWWTVLLGLSLMLNLLVAGVVLGHRFVDGPPDRLIGASYVQLVPRRFLAELPRDRRRELMELVRNNRDSLRQLRGQSEAVGLKLADVLVAEPFDIARVQSTVDEFAASSQGLAAKGGAIVTEMVSRLTPDERELLADAIRDRAQRGKRHSADGPPAD